MTDERFFPVPTSLICSPHSKIAAYEAAAFLPRAIDYGGRVLRAEKPDRPVIRKILVPILAVLFVSAAIAFAVSAAQADPAQITDRATLIRFTNKAAFGAPEHTKVDETVDKAFERFKPSTAAKLQPADVTKIQSTSRCGLVDRGAAYCDRQTCAQLADVALQTIFTTCAYIRQRDLTNDTR